MGSIAKQKSSADFKPLDEGTHLAICNAVIDIGLQSTPFGVQEHVWLRFEVPAERISYVKDGEEIDAAQIICTRYNKTLTKKANLRKDLEAWFGREFISDELDGFDLFNLAGMPCLLTVVKSSCRTLQKARTSTTSTRLPDWTKCGDSLRTIPISHCCTTAKLSTWPT